jgi:murein DD-endopeptidase MepM/ murein hydrolase activator NlpD
VPIPSKKRIRLKKINGTRKKRGFPLIRILLAVFVLIILIKVFSLHDSQNSETIRSASLLPEIDLQPSHRLQKLQKALHKEKFRHSHVIRSGDTFYGLFALAGIKPDESALLLQLLKNLDVHTLYPGDSLVIIQNADSTFHSLHYINSAQVKYSIDNRDSMFRAVKESPSISYYRYLINGTLETSLSEAIFSMGVSDVITFGITDIFAWDINFFIDPQMGDHFQILFEKKVINGRFSGCGNIIAARYALSKSKTFCAFGFCDSTGKILYYDSDGNAVQKQFLKAPLRYSRVSSGFSYRRKHPILGIVRPHLGIDYAAPYGTPVHSAADGKIIFKGKKGGYGNLVIVAHGGAYQTYYGHLQSFTRKIHTGSYVTQGDIIGKVGATGLATGPHLDYRMKKGKRFINPMNISSPSLCHISDREKNSFNSRKEMCESIFNGRFKNRQGCFLLDIKTPFPEKPVVKIVKKTGDTPQS